MNKENKILFISEYTCLRKNGLILFNKHILEEEKTKKCYDAWEPYAKKIVTFQKKLGNLEKVSDEKLKNLFEEWYENYRLFWKYGFIPEVANWGGEMLLKEKLLEKHEENFLELFEILTAPEKLSFFQKEELDLLKLKGKEERLEEHQKKYYWLKNSFGHEEILPVEYFQKELEKYNTVETQKKLKEIKEFTKKTKQRKQKVIRKYNISKKIQKIGKRLSYSIWWQDYRKKFIFIAIAETEKFIKEISKRLKIPKKELYLYKPEELRKLLLTNKKIKTMLDRKKGFVDYYDAIKGLKVYIGKEAKKIMQPFLETKIDKTQTELKGLPVSRGKLKGIVRILHSPKEMDKMEEGDVLVTAMTSPDFIFAMKKAGAIVTDEGGMTSHAAIVSRELGKPCIVGTKIATKLLKDGDLIEVDAEKGVVKILEK